MAKELGKFAQTIFNRTYASHPEETWEECAQRVAKAVAGDDKELEKEFFEVISERKFMPGGRYLAQAGKEINQFNNCFLLKAKDSREGWGDLLNKHVVALSTGGGVGTEYSKIRGSGQAIKKFGGVSSGPLALMKMVNEIARHVMAGGKRRSALWAGLNWKHPDIEDFIVMKNWPTFIRGMKEQDHNYPAEMDMTNISVGLDDEFFKKVTKDDKVWDLYYRICKGMCKTGEPGFSINTGKNKKDTLRNPCLPGWSTVLTPEGIRTLDEVNVGSVILGKGGWTKITNKWSTGIKPVYEYRTTRGAFVGTSDHRVIQNGEKIRVKDAEKIDTICGPQSWDYSLESYNEYIMDGLVLGDGGVHKASNNLVLLYIGDKDQDYFDSEVKSLILKHRPGINKKTWEVETSITSDELPRTWKRIIPNRYYRGEFHVMQAFLRGLFSANGSIVRNRITLKQSSRIMINQVQEMLSALGMHSYITITKPKKTQHHNGEYESKQSYCLNISDSDSQEIFFNTIGFIQKYKELTKKGVENPQLSSPIVEIIERGNHEVYDITVDNSSHTFWTGGCLVSNCNEVVASEEDGIDVCNLGSINLPSIKDIDELKRVTRTAVRFLYMGTFKSWLPQQDFYDIREKNRRIGLGILGLHEWCIRHGERYEPNGELGKWLSCWANISDDEADKFSKKMKGVRPVAVRAIAPTGTIGIIAESSTGIEPIYCIAYKRKYLENNGKLAYQYVVDPAVEKLVKEGIVSDPNDIEDAMKLSRYVERRIRMQAYIQSFVDQAISSTINMPAWGEIGNNNAKQFAETLLEYLPKLRGITTYPDESRPNQPITPVKWETAIKNGAIAESDENCKDGVCGI